MIRPRAWWIIAAGLALFVVFTALTLRPDLDRHVPVFLALYAAAFACYVAGIWIASTLPATRATLIVIVLVGIAARLVLIAAPPTLSTDMYRYQWEGRVVLSGDNPFALAPNDPSLEPLRDANFQNINHPHLETIYPPLAQGIFALGAMFPRSIIALKILFVCFDVGTVLLLMLLLRDRGLAPAKAIVYAWSPLAIFETAHSGHVDALGIFFLVAGLLFFERRRGLRTTLVLAMAFLAKFGSAILIPYFVARRRYIPWILTGLIFIVVAYLPFVGARGKLLSSLLVYSEEWQFNGFIYRAFEGLIGDPIVTRRVLGVGLLVLVLGAAWRQRDLLRYTFVVVGAALLLAPTLYPWYVVWIVPFLCVYLNRAWLLFTGLVALSYWVWTSFPATGVWRLSPTILVLEYVPFYVLLVISAWRGRMRSA